MLSMLIAYDAAGDVIATLDHMVARDHDGDVIGLVDFAANEQAGTPLTDIWVVERAVGSGSWPEWIGMAAHDFRVERSGGRIVALVHRQSGHRRDRAAIESAIAQRIAEGQGQPIDIRDLVGGPDRPLILDAEGRTVGRTPPPTGTPPGLAVLRGQSEAP